MFKSFKTIKNYYRLAKIKPLLLFFEFLSLLIPSLLSIISTILTAHLITAITVYDFKKATLLLSIDFGFIVATAVFYLIYHFLNAKTNKTIITNYQQHLYSNVKQNPNIKSLNLSAFSNVFALANFNKNLLYKICFLIKSVIVLSIIAKHNIVIALALVGVSFVSVFLLKFTDTKIQTHSKNLSENQLQSLELFNSIKRGVGVEETFNLETALKDKYFGYVDDGIKTHNRISLFYNINNNFISLVLKTAVFVSTFLLISQIKSTTLTLSLYLILTPYLTSSAQNLIAFFDIFSEIGLVENTLQEFELYKFQAEQKPTAPISLSTFNLYFFNVSQKDKSFQMLNHINLKIEFGSTINFVGKKHCGKRAIYQMLKKVTKPSTGSIFLDEKNISDLPPESFSKLFSFTTSKPHFFDVSIFENLLMVCQNKTKITKTLKNFNLLPHINALPKKQNSVLDISSHPTLAFFLGLARSYLSGAKIICIYETPNFTTKQDVDIFENILNFLHGKCTVLLFSHTDQFKTDGKKTYYFEQNTLQNADIK